jgi:hypothetical protein
MEGMENIPMCDVLYHVALDIAKPLPKTSNGNKYIIVVLTTIQNGVKCIL